MNARGPADGPGPLLGSRRLPARFGCREVAGRAAARADLVVDRAPRCRTPGSGARGSSRSRAVERRGDRAEDRQAPKPTRNQMRNERALDLGDGPGREAEEEEDDEELHRC